MKKIVLGFVIGVIFALAVHTCKQPEMYHKIEGSNLAYDVKRHIVYYEFYDGAYVPYVNDDGYLVAYDDEKKVFIPLEDL